MKDLLKILSTTRPVEPPAGLFDRIILAINKEQTKRACLRFLSCLVISFIAIPVSGIILANQIQNSGILYFLSTAFGNFGTFLTLWQDFSLALLESLPITGIIAFVISMSIALFTLRLFLCRKKLLLNYLKL